MSNGKETDWVAGIGLPAYASIVDMVAALECDYDRLQELAEERETEMDAWREANPDADLGEAPAMSEELVDLLAAAGECDSREDAEQRIQEDALTVEVRSDWHAPGTGTSCADGEFNILLSTGGPAVRIIGELNDGEPCRARLEVQDWFKPWAEYVPTDKDTLLAYARCFYYGE